MLEGEMMNNCKNSGAEVPANDIMTIGIAGEGAMSLGACHDCQSLIDIEQDGDTVRFKEHKRRSPAQPSHQADSSASGER